MKDKFKSFRLFFKAMSNTKHEMWVTVQVLIAISIVLALILWAVESSVQSEFNIWGSLTWPFMQYIEDPGGFADYRPVTIVGRIIAVLVGIIGIAIFAVPAGLIGSGFMDAIAEDKREKELEEYRVRIRKSFRRFINKKTQYRVAPRRVTLASLQAKKGMIENDIIDTVSKFDEFRLRNLADSQVASEHPQDRLVIEMLPLDKKTVDGFDIVRKNYGIMIDRQSNVTIIAPTAATENSVGHFAYYLAQFGGFNYVSREFVTDVDEPVSYYTIQGEEADWETPLKYFIEDVKQLSQVKEHWNIVLASADNVHDTQFHFVHRANEKSGLEITTLDETKFQEFFIDFSERMKTEYGYMSDMDEKYRPIGNKNIGIKAGGGVTNNAFILRISYSVTTWSDRPAPIIIDMAKVIKQHLETPERSTFKDDPSWKDTGCGYGTNKKQ